METFDFRGTGKLLLFYLKKGWIKRIIWLLTPALLALAGYQSYSTMFASNQELVAFVDESILNPVVAAIHGFILTKDIPGLVVWNIKTISLIVAGIFNILAMTQMTRGEEETGRTDILCSLVIGRQSQLAAASILCVGVNATMGLLLAFSMTALGMPFAGAVGMGLLITIGSSLFTALAALSSQLTASRRAASSLAIAFLGVFYTIAFFNNLTVDINISSYLTPFRWFFILRPYAENNFWILPVSVFIVLILFISALKLSARRDIGDGAIPHKTGRADAPSYLRNIWALSYRMHRGGLFSWLMVLFLFAVGIGSVDGLVADMLNDVPTLASWMNHFGAPEEAFLALMIFVLSMFIAAYGIISIQRIRAEEAEQHIDAVLSTTVTRSALMGSHMIYGFFGTMLIAFAVGLGIMLGKGMSGGLSDVNWGPLLASLYKLPAIWIIGGMAILFFGMLPRLSTAISWGIFSLFIALQLFWEMGLLPETAFLLSPLGHVYPTRPQTPTTFVMLTIVALILYMIGFRGFKRRDIQQ